MNYVFACPVGRGNLIERLDRPALRPVVAYSLGAMAGGALVGVTISALGNWASSRMQSPWSLLVVGLAAALSAYAAKLEWTTGAVRPFPQRERQVPRPWTLWRSKTRSAAAFGMMLGGGVFTFLHHASAYVLAVALFLSAAPAVGAAAGVTYGGVRALTLVEAWWRREPAEVMTERVVRRRGASAAALRYVALISVGMAAAAGVSGAL
jgi:hypothetical protein